VKAREKLNKVHAIGILVAAAMIGGLAGSWTVFAVVAAMITVGGIYIGTIRPGKRRIR
jgi:hypothetical protein